jgi:predicted ATP-dependent endonuclease of OLD family
MAFLEQHTSDKSKPILLVDEVEQHLHYDAQADVIQMLSKQEGAQKIIYTTHSIGCLPNDLGCGVKVIVKTGPDSAIKQSFWDSNRPGYYPLLSGMGAFSLAFIPLRMAVVGEGPSEMLLLPTLLREVTGKPSLPYQVLPGLSVANAASLSDLDGEAPRVLYLVDSDDGGREIKKTLRKANISPKKIVDLSEQQDTLVIEDLIDPATYVASANILIRKKRPDGPSIPDDALTGPNIPLQLKHWCKQNNVEELGKMAVAYQLLELSADTGQQLHRTDRRNVIELLAAKFDKAFKIEQSRRGVSRE